MYRVSSNRPDRGPLAPRPLDYKPFDDRKGWSRFDVGPASAAAGPGLTIYGATRRDTAFVEVLAWKSAPSATYSKLVEEAMFTGSSIDELLGDLHGLGIPVGGSPETGDWSGKSTRWRQRCADGWTSPTGAVSQPSAP